MRPGRAGALGQCPGPGLLLLLLGVLGGAASEPHSLRYFYTAVSDQSPGVPQFLTVGSVDGEVFVRYDSETRKMEPRVDWIVANTDQQYWDRETEISQSNEKFFRANLDTLRERYNQSSGSSRLLGSPLTSAAGRHAPLLSACALVTVVLQKADEYQRLLKKRGWMKS